MGGRPSLERKRHRAMPPFKLTYFNGRGRAEVIRYIMAYAGFKYEDNRIDEQSEWPEFKPKTPFGKVPVLEVGGRMICQSKTISRYLAKKAGLMGGSDWEEAQINMVVECLTDFVNPIADFMFEQDEQRKIIMGEKVQDSLLTDLNKLENLIPPGSKNFVGNKMSWADLEASYILDFPASIGFTMNLEDTPKLKAVKETVDTHPRIAGWIAKRPKTAR